MGRERKERPREAQAVKTTIVGGRPPGSGKGLGETPRGIEVLVQKAAVDAEFKQLLLMRRADAAREIELELAPAEAAMLNAVPAAQLEAIIARTTVHPKKRAAFLGRAAAVMLAALGAGVGCEQEAPKVGGTPPDKPRVEQPAPTTSTQPAAPQEKAGTSSPAGTKATTAAPAGASDKAIIIVGIMPAEPSPRRPSTQAPAQKSPIPMPVAGAVPRPLDYPTQPGSKATTQTPAQKSPIPISVAGAVRSPLEYPTQPGLRTTTQTPAQKAPATEPPKSQAPPELQKAVRGLRPLREDK